MKKLLSVVLLVSMFSFAFSQSGNRWSDWFSYSNVLAFKESNGKIIAATENGVFYYDTISGEITKLSKANGLHEVKISAFDYNQDTKVALIGYKSGNLDVVTEDGVTYVVDIPLSQSYTGSKVINNISINGDKAVISVGYGVSIFDLTKKEFGDTCFFFNGTSYISALESVIKDDVVYSVTSSGIKSHPLNVTFSVYTSWATTSGNYSQLAVDSIFALGNATKVYFGTAINSLKAISDTFVKVKDIKIQSQNIVVTDQTKVYIYNLSGVLQKTFDAGEELNSAYFVNSKLYSASKFSGILDESKNSYKPDGPYSNTSYKIQIIGDKLWVSSGGRDGRYNPAIYPNPDFGFFYYDGKEWIYPSYFKNNPISFNALDVTANPSNNNEVFMTNYNQTTGQGIYRFNYNEANKDFDFVKYYQFGTEFSLNRPVGLTFDENNNLIGSMAFSISYTDVSSSLLFYDKPNDNFVVSNLGIIAAAQKPIIADGIIWLPTPRQNYFVAYNHNNTPTNLSDDKKYVFDKTLGLPDSAAGTLSVSLDKSGDIWIGSDRGLRVLSGGASSLDNNPKVEPIIITQNGLAEELFKDLGILQIETDSGNQKWVSVDGGGVFYLSSNGENTIQHFTAVNSPLPDDTVTDIKVDPKTGKVYFVTFEGIVVYQGDVSNVTSNFGDVKVYPNPVVTAQYKGNVKITGLAEKTNIRITDAAGNLVHSAVARGGYYEWNLNNPRGSRVASGIYFVLMTNEDGTDKATAKIAVVN